MWEQFIDDWAATRTKEVVAEKDLPQKEEQIGG